MCWAGSAPCDRGDARGRSRRAGPADDADAAVGRCVPARDRARSGGRPSRPVRLGSAAASASPSSSSSVVVVVGAGGARFREPARRRSRRAARRVVCPVRHRRQHRRDRCARDLGHGGGGRRGTELAGASTGGGVGSAGGCSTGTSTGASTGASIGGYGRRGGRGSSALRRRHGRLRGSGLVDLRVGVVGDDERGDDELAGERGRGERRRERRAIGRGRCSRDVWRRAWRWQSTGAVWSR